jgi:hypothetical protein
MINFIFYIFLKRWYTCNFLPKGVYENINSFKNILIKRVLPIHLNVKSSCIGID